MQRGQTVLAEYRSAGLQIRCIYNQQAIRARGISRSQHLCACRASRSEDSKIPVVDDATVLPPPPTGSQYAWRRSWAGSGSESSSGSGGDGGAGGRSQARTKDWGKGPHSSLLFFLMYRIRMLLLYGAWVTVLYGAVRAVCDVSARISQGVMYVAGKATRWGSVQGSSINSEVPSSLSSDIVNNAATAAIIDSQEAGLAAELQSPDQGPSESRSNSNINGSSSRFASINAYLQDRPTARVFSDLMTCVIPLYLMLLGSVVFFASM